MTTEEFRVAQKVRIPFGKYNGATLDKIAESDEGLEYLDWLNGQTWLAQPFKVHLMNYLSDPTIEKELREIIRKKPDFR